MARVNIVSVNFVDNPCSFKQPYKLEVTFEAFSHLEKDIEWQLIYVGSGASNEYDQLLDSVFIGPTPEGRHQFVFETDPADVSKIPKEDLLGVAGLLLKAKYDGQEFICLGWYVQVQYAEPELNENPPNEPNESKLMRQVMVDDVRVTNYPIKWDDIIADEPVIEDPIGDEDIAIDLAEENKEEAEEMESSDDDEEEEEETDEGESDLGSEDTDEGDEEEVEDDEKAGDGNVKAIDEEEDMEVENTADVNETNKEKPNNAPTEEALNDVTNA